MSFLENQLHQMNISSEVGSSSSEGWLETVRDGTKHVAKIIDTISEKLSKSDALKAIGSLSLKRGKNFRFLLATTAAGQLEEINQQPRDGRDSVGLSVTCQIRRQSTMAQGNKEVFLCHSGKQKNFIRQLHRDLSSQHISCFFDEDDNSLPLADKFPPRIFEAAETCKIAVVVLSKEFILSKWPMLELSAFISAKNSGRNANLKILPIFFMITPKELSRITKDSREWKKLEKNNGIRGEWQDALKEVRFIKGLSLAEDGNEVHLRDKVVKEVCSLLELMNLEFPILREAPQNQSHSEASLNFSMDLQIPKQLTRRREQFPLHPGMDYAQSDYSVARESDIILYEERQDTQKDLSLTATTNLTDIEIIEMKSYCNDCYIIGEGAFGEVYRGSFRGGDVAIKKIRHTTDDCRIFFENEVRILQGKHHKNLLSLIAWCIKERECYLVYEYVNGCSLEDYSTKNGTGACLGWKRCLKIRACLSWKRCLKIIQHIAEGIQFLHKNKIIHTHIKPENLMLDITSEEVKIISLGTSRQVYWEGTHIFTDTIVGSPGYWAPEYFLNGKLSYKQDVYGFGIVVLEVITGQKYIYIIENVKDMMDINWFRKAVAHRINEDGWDEHDMKTAMAVAELALRCADVVEEKRPHMDFVVRSLNSIASHKSGEEGESSNSSALQREFVRYM